MPWEKSYDETEVLERAMTAFWARGYEATSMRDLVEATGINRASIYSAFTDKHTLFMRALEHYDRHYRGDFLDTIASENRGRDAILAVFCAAAEAATGQGKCSGCLMVNTALELAGHDPEVAQTVEASFVELENFFARAVAEGQQDGTIDKAHDARSTAQALLSMFLGMRVLARPRPDETLHRTISRQVNTLLD
jgi:TetR/AcrR family transcriptional repressor of nem operon